MSPEVATEVSQEEMIEEVMRLAAEPIAVSKLGTKLKAQFPTISVSDFKALMERVEKEGLVEKRQSGKGFVVIATREAADPEGELPDGPSVDSPSEEDLDAAQAQLDEESRPASEVITEAAGSQEAEEPPPPRKRKKKSDTEVAIEQADELVVGYEKEDVDRMMRDSLDLQTIKKITKRMGEFEALSKELKKKAKALSDAGKYLDERLKKWASDDGDLPSSDELSEPKSGQQELFDEDKPKRKNGKKR